MCVFVHLVLSAAFLNHPFISEPRPKSNVTTASPLSSPVNRSPAFLLPHQQVPLSPMVNRSPAVVLPCHQVPLSPMVNRFLAVLLPRHQAVTNTSSGPRQQV